MTTPNPTQRTPKQVADNAYLRYQTDAEFHAKVYRAAQIGQQVENELGDLFSFDSALLGAAIVLYLDERDDLQRRIERVLALHCRVEGTDICGHCEVSNGNAGPFVMWPCPTVLAIRDGAHA